MTVFAEGKILGKVSRCAVLGSQCVNAVFESFIYFCMSKDDFSRRLFYVATSQAIHLFCIIVWNFLDIG